MTRKERAIEIGKHVAETGDSLRTTSEKFFLSYSYTTSSFLMLEIIDKELYEKALKKQNKARKNNIPKNKANAHDSYNVQRGKRRKVALLDYETGGKLKEYESIARAAEDNYIDYRYLRVVLKHNDGCMPNLRLRFKYI